MRLLHLLLALAEFIQPKHLMSTRQTRLTLTSNMCQTACATACALDSPSANLSQSPASCGPLFLHI